MPIVIELKIIVDDKGQVAVTGPIEQTMLCYGLLEVAKDVLRARHTQSKIQPPGPADVLTFGAKQ